MQTAKQIQSLSDDQLTQQVQRLVSEERRITTELLWHLREVEARMLYAKRGFPSLFEYCTRGLGYSEGATGRRVAAMRLLKEIPESVTSALQEGRVSLSSAAAVQVFLQREKREQGRAYSPAEKQALFRQVEGKSQRETERHLLAISPQAVLQERERPVTATQTEIRFVADEALMAKFEKLRELNSHKNPNATYVELIGMMADLAIESLEKKREPKREVTPAPESRSTKSHSRYVPVAVKRSVWSRDRGQCTYRDPKSGRLCASRRFIELDHIRAFSLGGGSTVSNLRLRCRAHNQLWARQTFGK